MTDPLTSQRRLRIGLFSIGLDTYWPQFPGLRERLEGYGRRIAERLQRETIDIVPLGMIDSAERAVAAGHAARQQDIDLLLVHVATYALSSTVLPIVRRARVPCILLNLAPGAAIDYVAFNKLADRTIMTGEWLAWCQACPMPEIANVFRRANIPFFQVTGMFEDDPHAWNQLNAWIDAASVAYRMEHNRLGLMGHYYSGMLDIYSDTTLQSSVFGTHIEILEVDELSALRRQVSDAAIAKRCSDFNSAFAIQPDCTRSELERAARTSCALDTLVGQHRLGALAYYYKGTGVSENEETMSSIILGTSLLTGRGIPVAGEYEVKNVQAMKILDLFGAGGSFTEYYAIDFREDVVLMGHDGPGHTAIAEGQVKVRPLTVYHGKVGRGLSVEMSVKHGPVTLLSVAEDPGGTLKLVIAQGESVPGPILEVGNTNSRYRFPLGARGFIEAWNQQGAAHHCAIGLGHVATKLEKLAALLNLGYVRVC